LARLSALFVDLLLGMFCLLIRDDGAGVEVANLEELAEVLGTEARGTPPFGSAPITSEYPPAAPRWTREAA
jgi:hypothetical protein